MTELLGIGVKVERRFGNGAVVLNGVGLADSGSTESVDVVMEVIKTMLVGKVTRWTDVTTASTEVWKVVLVDCAEIVDCMTSVETSGMAEAEAKVEVKVEAVVVVVVVDVGPPGERVVVKVTTDDEGVGEDEGGDSVVVIKVEGGIDIVADELLDRTRVVRKVVVLVTTVRAGSPWFCESSELVLSNI